MNQQLPIRASMTIALIMALRLFGFFILIPIFSVEAQKLTAATPFLIGIAFGIHGLSQALLQIPLGALSDRIGRKAVISIGLGLFALGGLIAAFSHSIIGILIGRFLQGAGAIGSTLIALLADMTPAPYRARSMAIVGVFISLAFALALIVGSYLNPLVGLHGLFGLSVLLALLAFLLLHTLKTPAQQITRMPAAFSKLLKQSLADRQLQWLNLSIFMQHAIFSAFFVAIPIVLHQSLDQLSQPQWFIYLIMMVLSFGVAIPLIAIAEKRKSLLNDIRRFIIVTLLLMLALTYVSDQTGLSLVLVTFYLIAFNFLEASLPALVSQYAAHANRGLSLGVYSSCQFFGIFVGGGLAGYFYQQEQISWIFLSCAIMGSIWYLSSQRLIRGKEHRGETHHGKRY